MIFSLIMHVGFLHFCLINRAENYNKNSFTAFIAVPSGYSRTSPSA